MNLNKQITVLAIVFTLIFFPGCNFSDKQTSLSTVECIQSCESNTPKIIFGSTEHDFGKVDAEANKTCIFDFINDGDKDLVIEKIHASCGCTTTTMQNTTIKPGQAPIYLLNSSSTRSHRV